eukprot:m.295683 g.295683  ORF g.295683 m.295683 type:complete len:777 (-) comp13240_c0_seq1:505-2835(-)
MAFPKKNMLPALAFVVAFFAATSSALPEGFVHEQVVGGLGQPMDMVALPDNRLIVIERTGTVLIVDPATGKKATYMQFPAINTQGEKGVTSIVLDPNFNKNKYFYVYWSPKNPEFFRISRFEHKENSGGLSSRGDFDSEEILWTDTDGYYFNGKANTMHFGGGMVFGADGMIWLTIGDNGQASWAHDNTKMAGKIIRIDPATGDAPSDNWGRSVSGANKYIHANGLRNPFRAFFDAETDRLLIAEVGGNNNGISTEDLHLGAKGVDYGWPFCEGNCDNPKFPTCSCGKHDDPLYTYSHNKKNAAIIGGVVYRGGNFPSEFQGAYFFGDFPRRQTRVLKFNSAGKPTTDTLIDDIPKASPTSFLQGHDGALYVTAFDRWTSGSGQIRRFKFKSGSNAAPVIVSAEADKTGGELPLKVTFTGDAIDPEDDALVYSWDMGDGTVKTGSTVSYTFKEAGTFQVVLTVSDGERSVQADSISIAAGKATEVSIISPQDGDEFVAGDIIKIKGAVDNPNAKICWNIDFKHDDHLHPEMSCMESLNGQYKVPNGGHGFETDTALIFQLVAEANGVRSEAKVTIYPKKINVLFDTIPSGLSLSLDGVSMITPAVIDPLIGFRQKLHAPRAICKDEAGFEFQKWTWKKKRETKTPIRITYPDKDRTFVAKYKEIVNCQNGGSCQIASDKSISCNCPNGYSGTNCENESGGESGACLSKGTDCKSDVYGCCGSLVCNARKPKGAKQTTYACEDAGSCVPENGKCKKNYHCCSRSCNNKTGLCRGYKI